MARGAGKPSVYYVLASEQFTTPELVHYGAAAEEAGFDGVWTSDHFQPWQENEGHSASAWVTLSALTQRTSKIILGTGVTCPIFRYRPAIVAQVWASLDLLAPSRMFLGLGAGEKLNEGAAGGGWGSFEERSSRLIEAVKIIRALWTGTMVHMKGNFWEVHAKLYDPPDSKIPIYIAAGGKKSAYLAGRHGDGLIIGGSDLKNKPELKSSWEEGVREEGGDPEKKPVVAELWAVVGGKEEARSIASKWRFVPKAWQPGYFDNISPVEIQARAEKELSLENVYGNWTASTDPQVHADAIKELADLGATHVVVHVASPDQLGIIDYFGRSVLPSIRK